MKDKNIIKVDSAFDFEEIDSQIGPMGTNTFDREMTINTSILKSEWSTEERIITEHLGYKLSQQLTEDEVYSIYRYFEHSHINDLMDEGLSSKIHIRRTNQQIALVVFVFIVSLFQFT